MTDDDLPATGNLFEAIPRHAPEELTTVLLASPVVRIERIVSTGQRSPDGFWYDQPEAEWVIVLRGQGVLLFDNGSRVCLGAGDFVLIEPHRRHRVESTSADEPTVWLAVFITPTEPPAG